MRLRIEDRCFRVEGHGSDTQPVKDQGHYQRIGEACKVGLEVLELEGWPGVQDWATVCSGPAAYRLSKADLEPKQ